LTGDRPTGPLLEWNRLARENTENAIVSAMYDGLLASSAPLDIFLTWLLVGTAAIASFFISNGDKIIPFIDPDGFRVCGGFLIGSCIFGFLSKIFALRCRIGLDTTAIVKQKTSQYLEQHNAEEEEIQKVATDSGVSIESGIRLDRVMEEFLKPAPFWVGWMMRRHLKEHGGNPQIAYLVPLKYYKKQNLFGALQILAFLGFLIAGFAYV